MKARQCINADCSCYRPDMKAKSKPRAGKYERLLKALLKKTWQDENGNVRFYSRAFIDGKLAKQLIAIKERIEKGAKV